MRWRYPDVDDPATARGRRAIVESIDRWWDTFARHADALDAHFDRRAEADPAGVMEALDAVDPGFMWEFGPAVAKPGHRLCITPESQPELRPLLDVVLEQAPSLPRWEFHPYRLAESPDEFRGFVDGRTKVRADGVMVAVEPGNCGTLSLRYHIPAAAWPGEKEASKFAFFATERLLGEERLDKWIGLIESTADAASTGAIPAEQLAAKVDAMVALARVALPAVPRFQLADEQWSSLKIKDVPTHDDYPGWSDLYVAVTPDPAVFQAAHAGRGFYSERFSRCVETFCYLKIDGRDGLDPAHFGDRGDVEDALTAALSRAGLGSTRGGGTGRIYSYIDLALTDVRPAMEVIRAVLRRGDIHRRSWLLFYDADLQREWLGVWPDTPAPPGL